MLRHPEKDWVMAALWEACVSMVVLPSLTVNAGKFLRVSPSSEFDVAASGQAAKHVEHGVLLCQKRHDAARL